VSGHVGEAAASPSSREQRYRHWSNYKLIRKRAMKRLKRKAKGGCSLETTMAYLSHAKQTASLRHVAGVLWHANPMQRPEIYNWLKTHGSKSKSWALRHHPQGASA
jgi:hypothetical protein